MSTIQALLTDAFSLRRASVFAHPEFATDILPVGYGDLTGGAGGISYCPQIDTTANKHLIFDHEILSAANGNSPTFYSDRVVTAPASWNPAEAIGGKTASTVTFGSSQTGKRVGYRGKGKASGATFFQNPISVIEDFLETVIGVPVSSLNATALEIARNRAAAQAYLAAGVLVQDQSPGATIADILSCFAGLYYLTPDGTLALVLDIGASPTMADLAAHLRPQDLAEATATWSRADITNQVAVQYCYNGYDNWLQVRFQGYDDGSMTADVVSQSLHGVRGPGYTSAALQWLWARDQASVRAVQAVIVKRLATGRPVITLTAPNYRYVHVETGDFVGYSSDWMFDGMGRRLRNQIGIVEETDIDLDQAEHKLVLRDTGSYITTAGLRDIKDYAG